MKSIKKTILFTFISLFVFSSCDELLNVNSERVVFPDEYDFTGANDTLFLCSVFIAVGKPRQYLRPVGRTKR